MKVIYVEDNVGDQLSFMKLFETVIDVSYKIVRSIKDLQNELVNGEFDIIVTDFNLPDGNGFDVLKLNSDIPVVVITSQGNEEIAVKLLKGGARDYLIKDLEGNYLKILPVVLENLAKHIQAEKAQALLAAIVESAGDAIFTIDNNELIVTCNNGVLRMYGYTEQEIKGTPFHKLCNECVGVSFKEFLNKIRAERSTIFDEMINVKKDGTEINVYMSISPVFNKFGKVTCFSIITKDITDIKRKDAELNKANSQIERAKYLDAQKDEFIGIASHELKTPLTSIKAYLQMLERQIQSPSNTDKSQLISSFQKTNIFIKRLELLINDLLDVSKIQAGKLQYNMESMDINDLVRSSVEIARTLTSTHVISIKGYTNEQVEADRFRMEEVFTNFLSNAFKYSPKNREIILSYFTKNHELVVCVEDHGIGISEVNSKNIFKRYFRVEDKSYKFTGLGVGLYICKEIIARHHGKVWLESEIGKGSKFYFSIPLKQPSQLLKKIA